MSVHGYPADMSIFVQLGLLKLQEDTSHADIDQDDVSLAGVLQDAVGRVFSILQRLVDADFAAVEIGFYAQCWSCFSELDVGWSEPLLIIFNWQNELRE